MSCVAWTVPPRNQQEEIDMLMRRDGDTLVIVRQTDHMAQVARIAERWGNERFPAPAHREETIRAAGLHDNGWRLWEDHPTLVPETGRPRNLGEIEPSVHAAFYRAGVDAAVAVDPYTGLLVSLHAAVLSAGVDGWDLATLTPPERPDIGEVERAFIAEQAALQRRLRAALAESPRYGPAVEPRRLWPAYLRLRFWDRLSLYFVFFGMGERAIDRTPTVTRRLRCGRSVHARRRPTRGRSTALSSPARSSSHAYRTGATPAARSFCACWWTPRTTSGIIPCAGPDRRHRRTVSAQPV